MLPVISLSPEESDIEPIAIQVATGVCLFYGVIIFLLVCLLQKLDRLLERRGRQCLVLEPLCFGDWHAAPAGGSEDEDSGTDEPDSDPLPGRRYFSEEEAESRCHDITEPVPKGVSDDESVALQ